MHPSRFMLGKSRRDIDRLIGHRVRSANRHIAGYRKLLAALDLDPARIRDARDLAALPIVSKRMLYDLRPEETLHEAAVPSMLFRTRTSGYTGMPVDIYMSRIEALFRQWQLLRTWQQMTTLPPRFRVADLGGWVADPSGFSLARRGPAVILRISQQLSTRQQRERIESFAPHVVTGPPTALDLLAQEIHDTGSAIASARLVAARGEILFPAVRVSLEEAFGCRVADFYICEEIGVVAAECPADPDVYHINTDTCIVESVNEDGTRVEAGREGRLLLTNLYNYTMPLIRYDIGDRGTCLSEEDGKPCSCGSRRPRMQLIGGRQDDYAYLPNGRRISPRLLGTAVYRAALPQEQDGRIRSLFRGFQAVQDALDHVTIHVIPERGHERVVAQRISQEVRNLHPQLRCTVRVTDRIPREPSGKLKKVICEVRPNRELAQGRADP